MSTVIKRGLGLLGLLFVVLIVFVVFQLRGSLPQLDGRLEGHSHLGAELSLARDSQGTAIINAASKADAAYALGFAHGQDRFFQIDIQRRFAAGELSALVGDKAIEHDKQYRLHQMRQRAKATLTLLSPEDLDLLKGYSEGINAGLASLSNSPFEYLLLNVEPVNWAPEDSFLVSAFMFAQMTSRVAPKDYSRELLYRSGGDALVNFIQPEGTLWDTAIDGSQVAASVLPSAEQWSSVGLDLAGIAMVDVEAPMIGSNSWAVGGAMTKHGGALLANDPHLAFSLPHIWYRTQLNYPDDQGEMLKVVGVSLPGLPSVAIGSNGKVAWGMTNSAGDWADLIALDLEGDQYRTSEGLKDLHIESETIQVRGGEDLVINVKKTEWGPIYKINGETYAYRWLAHEPEALNAFEYLNLDRAKTVDEAVDFAQRSGISPFNFLVADQQGKAAWSLAGRLPKRGTQVSNRVVSWKDLGETWQGWLPSSDYPVVSTEQQDYLWTANNRIVGGESLNKIGLGQYELGTRGWLIEQDLKAQATFNEEDMARMVVNDKAVLLNPWRDYLLALLEKQPSLSADQQSAQTALQNWSARADVADVGYTVVNRYRDEFLKRINQLLIAKMQTQGLLNEGFDLDELWLFNRQNEGPLRILRDQAPSHWLPLGVASWNDWSLDMLDTTLAQLKEKHGSVAAARWGLENRLRMRHPLAAALPEFLQSYLNMPADELNGDSDMPLAQHPGAGQSMRFIVAPGHEEEGYLTMPAGQSGHPMSPYYRSSHEDWLAYRNTPLLPGEAESTLILAP